MLPQPPKPTDSKSLLPNRSLVLWPYSRWSDPRLHLHDDYILIKGEAQIPALKVGYANGQGWVGYLRNGVFFIKHFDPAPSFPHPDFGCSSEVYVNHLFIEVETLGSLLNLQPDQSTTLTETWEFFSNLAHFPVSHTGVRALVKHLGLP